MKCESEDMRRAARHDRAPEVKGPTKIQFTERKEKDGVCEGPVAS